MPMTPLTRLFALALLAAVLTGCTGSVLSAKGPSSPTPTLISASASSPSACPVTLPTGKVAPGESPDRLSYGNGALWVDLWPDGKVLIDPQHVESDGWLEMKFPWYRGVPGSLSITGHRLDVPAPPLRARIPDGYGNQGFQSTSIAFPMEGCWQVTGKVGDASLTVVTLVQKVDRVPWVPPASPTAAP